MPTLDDVLRKMVDSFQLDSSSVPEPETTATVGDPNCPICKGIGFVYRPVPPEHPDFGKIQPCKCARQRILDNQRIRLFSMANLEAFKDKNFDNFKVQGRMGLQPKQIESLQMALNKSMLFARSLQGWLLLRGTYGCGKTHLAAAIANDAVNNSIPTLFTTVPDLLDWLRFAYGDTEESFEDRFEHIRQIDLLVLDDLGTQNATEWAKEKLYQIINYRYANRKATVITTNQKLDDMDGRIRSRLEDRDFVNQEYITAPDYRITLHEVHDPLQLSTLNQHGKQTFETFSLREKDALPAEQKRSVKNILQVCKTYAERPDGWLVLQGDYGTGKTHLAAAIANFRVTSQGESPMFVVVPDLLDHLRATFNPNSSISYDTLFDQVRASSLLILDDFGTQNATPWAKEKLFQIFNFRYNAELPTIITTTLTIEEIDARIRTRMMDDRLCSLYKIDCPAYSGSKSSKISRERKKTDAPHNYL